MAFEKLMMKWAQDKNTRALRADRIKKSLSERGKPVFEKFGVHGAVLFGSVAEGRCEEHSDVDILVYPISNDQYWDLRHELEEALDVPVDLYTERDDPILVEKILSRGEVIYAIQP